jgi:hypothetical protein
VAGLLASCAAIFTNLFAGSALPCAPGNDQWVYCVALVVLGSLALGAIWSFLAPESEDVISLLPSSRPPSQMKPDETVAGQPHVRVTSPPVQQSRL